MLKLKFKNEPYWLDLGMGVRVKVKPCKYYDAQPTAEEFVYQVSMPDIRKAKNYIFDVYASENMIASGLQFNVKSEVTVEKDLF